MTRVFVSYTTRDSHISPRFLADVRTKVGDFGHTFVDLLDNDSIDPQARVGRELRLANIVLLLESESAHSSPWVRWELARASRLLVPVVRVPARRIARSGIVSAQAKMLLAMTLDRKALNPDLLVDRGSRIQASWSKALGVGNWSAQSPAPPPCTRSVLDLQLGNSYQ